MIEDEPNYDAAFDPGIVEPIDEYEAMIVVKDEDGEQYGVIVPTIDLGLHRLT